MKRFIKTIFVCSSLVALAGCGDDSPRQEQITKLRALGVEQNPVVAKPGTVVNLTFYLAHLQGQTIKPRLYTDTAFRYGQPATGTMVDAAPTEQKLGGISLYTLRAQYTIPSDAATEAALAQAGSLKYRYGIGFNDGSRDEVVVGDMLVYKSTADEQSWKIPTVSINQPLTTDISTTATVDSTIVNTNLENNNIGWFVSSGKLKNRDAKSTEWSEIGTGEQTLIVTTRGNKSGSFAIKTVKVNVK